MDAQQMLTTLLPLAQRARVPWDFALFAFTTFTEYPKNAPEKEKKLLYFISAYSPTFLHLFDASASNC